MYAMLKRMKQLRAPLQNYIKLLESSGKKKMVDMAEQIRLTNSDWHYIDQILNALEPYKEASLVLEA